MKNSEIKYSTKISELDLYAFYTIRNTPPKEQTKEKYILQFLGSSIPAPNTILLHFSDGNVIEKLAPYKKVLEKYHCEELRHFDIVEAKVIYHKQKLLIMMDFEIVYSGLDKRIGYPMDYDQFERNGFKNEMGSVTIPRSIVGFSDSDIEDELDFSKLPYLMEELANSSKNQEENTGDAANKNNSLLFRKELDLRNEFVRINVLTKFTKSW